MRCRIALLVLVLSLGLAGSALGRPAQPQLVTSTTLAITGHGYGHGVGMGQWGAYGAAVKGLTYDKILALYYPQTTLAQSPLKTVRALLADSPSAVTISSKSPFRLKDGSGVTRTITSGAVTVDPNLNVELTPQGQPEPLPGPLTFQPGKAPLVTVRPYRGSIQLQAVGRSLQVVNVVGIDDYARGVVTQEMLKGWPLEALKSQAVAARSYAVAKLQAGSVLYTDTRGQMYRGIDGESPDGIKAVVQTKGQVLLYGGQVATTYFSSSSGGKTTAITDLVPSAKPVPYLVSVKDPYDAASPWHNWGPAVFTSVQLSKALGVPGVTDVTPVPANAHARQIVLTTATGTKTLDAGILRTALGLRSTFVRVGLLSLSRPGGTATPGTALTLSGVARSVKRPVTLEQSVSGGAWTAGPALTIASDGTFSISVTPQQTTSYRLSAPGVKGQALAVPVAVTWKRRLAVSGRSRIAHRPRSAAFLPSDPLSGQQWYLVHDHAFDYWPDLPVLQPVLVGIVDTGIDATHPEFAGKIAAARSFVGGSIDDQIGHGTFVAGEIAAGLDNGQGIAGIAFPAKLLVAKVVGLDGTIDPAVEAKAIRWEVDQGARVINLSLGAVRDPTDPSVDSFSAVEAAAVRYATSHKVLVVAAVGNGDDSPSSPWQYASYPAALPHVIGVSAIAPDGSVPAFSNRDAAFNDMAAPGSGILSTFPLALTAARPTCSDQGYSDCGTRDYRDGDGTSFAAPQVSAAAALLIATNPALTPDQVSYVLERTAADVSPSSGCSRCTVGRDSLSGWGSLDVTAALEALNGPLPAPDRLEPNDDAGSIAPKVWGRAPIISATLDYWDDPVDVYSVKLVRGQGVSVSVHSPAASRLRLVLWKPGTQHVVGKIQELKSFRAIESRAGSKQQFSYRAAVGGWYDVEVKMAAPGTVQYSLNILKTG